MQAQVYALLLERLLPRKFRRERAWRSNADMTSRGSRHIALRREGIVIACVDSRV